MKDLNTLSIKDFNGGISPLASKGVKGSFAFGQGLNIRENNTLKSNQALKKDSGSVVVDLALAMFKSSDGAMYAFGDTGKIYRKASGGSWTLKYTDSDGRISGACEFKSTSNTFILYATATKLKKITLTNAGGTWSGNITEVGSFSNGISGDFHTMRVAIGVVIICDGDVFAMYDYEDAFNNAALRMPTGTQTRALLDRNDLVITGVKMRTLPEGYFITWRRTEDSWKDKKPAQGNGVNAMSIYEQGIVAQVGTAGKLKYWNFGDTVPLTVIPGTASAYPGAVAEYGTLPHIGMNGGSKNGVYSLGRLSLNDPRALNLEYIPSHGKLTGTEIGAMASDDTDLYVAWKDGSTYGIDITDSANKTDAIYESLKMDMEKEQNEKLIRHVKILLAQPLPAGCSVKVRYRVTRLTTEGQAADDANGWIPATMSDERDAINQTGEMKGIFDLEGQGEQYEVRVELYHSGNTSPEVAGIYTYFSFGDDI